MSSQLGKVGAPNRSVYNMTKFGIEGLTKGMAIDLAKNNIGLVKFASAPSAKKGGKPASTLWWDGVVIAKNISDEEAEAAFKLAMVGLDPANLGASPEAAPWISNAFDPAPSNIFSTFAGFGKVDEKICYEKIVSLVKGTQIASPEE